MLLNKLCNLRLDRHLLYCFDGMSLARSELLNTRFSTSLILLGAGASSRIANVVQAVIGRPHFQYHVFSTQDADQISYQDVCDATRSVVQGEEMCQYVRARDAITIISAGRSGYTTIHINAKRLVLMTFYSLQCNSCLYSDRMFIKKLPLISFAILTEGPKRYNKCVTSCTVDYYDEPEAYKRERNMC